MMRTLIIVLVSLLFSGAAFAQQRALEALRPSARALVGQEPLREFESVPVEQGRRDVNSGVHRAAYQVDFDAASADPVTAARAYLEAHGDRFGISPEDETELAHLQRTRAGAHVTFRQIIDGLPVYGARIRVSLNGGGDPAMAVSSFAAGLDGTVATPILSAADAAGRVRELFSGDVRLREPELVVVPSKPPRAAWRLLAWPAQGPPAEWEVLVDARTGEVLLLRNRALRLIKSGRGDDWTSSGAGDLDADDGLWTMDRGRPTSGFSGVGLVFDPDPLSSSGGDYGGAFSDADDARSEALADELVRVTLLELAQGEGGNYRLENDVIRIVGTDASGADIYSPPVEAEPDDFRYTRSHDGFEAVNAYYHIYRSHLYVQSLGLAPPEAPVSVNPHATTDDASYYLPGLNYVGFGTGGVDDAEDAQVVLHEYAHALLQSAAPGLLQTDEGVALHEGWADYWAASYMRRLVESGDVPRSRWRSLFRWDSGDGAYWRGRTVDRRGKYPDDAFCAGGNCSAAEQYADGLLWATTLMDVYDILGGAVTDRLVMASHYYLAAPVTFRDAAEALVQADRDLHGGAHLSSLVSILAERGYIDRRAPVITFEPLSDVALVDWPPRLVVGIEESAGIDSAGVYFEVVSPSDVIQDEGVFPLKPCDANYCGEFPLSADALIPGSRVNYRLYARDASAAKNAAHAPSASKFYSFEVTATLVLLPNAPNPFAGATGIRYTLPTAEHVHLAVFDVLGRRVAILADGRREAGLHRVQFDASVLAAGVYFVRLAAGERALVRQIFNRR